MFKLSHISKKLGDFQLNDVSLDIREGSYVVILGKSGSGKSMLLELMAGLQTTDKGEIINNHSDNSRIGILFQDYALFPHMTVKQNIEFPMRMQRLSSAKKESRVKELAAQMEISDLLHRYPIKLSGGEKQRVALARILALNPSLLLLDEPLSALDSNLRDEMRSLLRKLNQAGLTIVHVTHDYEEALALAQHIVVIDNGEIVQQGGPLEVFKNPSNAFVAGFTGMKNFYKAKVKDDNSVIIHGEKILYSSHIPSHANEGFVMIPQEEIILSHAKPESSANNNLSGKIKDIILNHYGYELLIDTGIPFSVYITAASIDRLGLKKEQEVYLSFKSSAVRFIEH